METTSRIYATAIRIGAIIPVGGLIADASPANSSNYVRVEEGSAVIHLEAISSLVLPN